MRTTINTLTVLVYITYTVAIYFFLFKEDYKLSSIILMFSILALNISYSMFKSYLKTLLMKPKKKEKEMLEMLNNFKAKKNDLPNCNCRDVNECDTWCIGKENYNKHH